MVRLLTLFVLVTGAVAHGIPAQRISIGREAPAVDLAAVEQRTRAFEAARRAEQGPPAGDRGPQVLELLGKAERALNAAGERSRFSLSDGRRAALAEASKLLGEARSQTERWADEAATVSARPSGLGRTPSVEARALAARRALSERLAHVRESLSAAIAHLDAERAGGLAGFIERLSNDDPAVALRTLQAKLREWGTVPPTPVLSAELTYVHGTPEASQPSAEGNVQPAYQSAATAPLALEDTTQDREVEASAEILAKAASLKTTAAAVDFVKNDLRLSWYYGLLGGATQTLRQGSGNDADLAALLVSLLRAQGTPARFVVGTIELPLAKLADLMGLLSETQSTQLDGSSGLQLAPAERDRVLAILSAAGIPFEPVATAGTVSAVLLPHVWVEAFLPYADYRGAGRQRAGKQWVPIEPTIPGRAKYVASAPALDLIDELQLSAAGLTDEYLASGETAGPLAFLDAKLERYLAEHHPELTLEQVRRTVRTKPERFSLVPGALPYRVVSVQGEYPFVPDGLKHQVHVTASDGGGSLFEATVPAHRLIGHRALFGYAPASAEDAELIASAGGLYQSPASAVGLVPSLTIDGVEIGRGERSIGLGVRHGWSIELVLPGGSKRRVDNEVIAGNLVAVGLAAPTNMHQEPAVTPLTDNDGPAPVFLFGRAVAYANAWTAAEDRLASTFGIVPVRPTANLVLVENQLEVDETFGVPQQVRWRGLQVDADLRTLKPIELRPGRGPEFLQLSGFEGSFREAQVLKDGTGEDSVSAVTVVQEAFRRGVPVVKIDPSSAVDSQLAGVSASDEVLRDIRELVARGRIVLVPAQSLQIRDWLGTGFIAQDPVTHEGGYFLSGRLSGGQTIVSPGWWQDPALEEVLKAPDAPKATDDRSLAARIFKVSATDFLRGKVDEALPKLLAVYVTTEKGIPVRGVKVTFLRAGKAKSHIGSKTAESADAYTDAFGRAQVQVYLSPSVMEEAILETPDRPGAFGQLIGLNEIQAQTTNSGTTLVLSTPFQELADPGEPAKVVLGRITERVVVEQLEIGVDVHATVVDAHDNPLANQSVAWSQSPAGGRFVEDRSSVDRPIVLDIKNAKQKESVTQITPTLGKVSLGYIAGPATAPAPDPTDYSVSAKVGKVEEKYLFRVIAAKQDEVRFVVSAPALEGYDGAVATPSLHLPVPVYAQLMRASGGAPFWVPISGKEPEYSEASIALDITDELHVPFDGGHFKESPFELAGVPGDTDKNAAFWIPFLASDKRQLANFSARVIKSDDEQRMNRAGGQEWDLLSYVGKVTIEAKRETSQGTQTSVDGCGAVTTDDVAALFRIGNPASEPLYVKLEVRSNEAGVPVVITPETDKNIQFDEKGRIIVLREAAATLRLPIFPGTRGGIVSVQVFVKDPFAAKTSDKEPPERLVSERAIQVVPATANVVLAAAGPASDTLQARLILPVRNFASAMGDDTTEAEPPIAIPAPLEFCAFGNGRLTVKSASEVVAAATIQVDTVSGDFKLSAVDSLPLPEKTSRGTILAEIAPGDPLGQPVTIEFKPNNPAEDPVNRALTLKTKIDDAGPLPVGHTFVKDVSVVDGHLAKQFVDLQVSGRGSALSMARTYTSQGFDEGPMGLGWNHNLRSYVVRESSKSARYMVVGGEGGGQVFDCDANKTVCTPQSGYHGSLTVTVKNNGTETKDDDTEEIDFRSKNGTLFHYSDYDSNYSPPRYWLRSIKDSSGNTTTFQYGGKDQHGELVRVFEPGNARYLQLKYSWPVTLSHPRLDSVGLLKVATPDASKPLDENKDGDALEICVWYSYDDFGRLVGVKRFSSACSGIDPTKVSEMPAERSEAFAYVPVEFESVGNNLQTYTDPNGVVTTYEWYANEPLLPGEATFTRFGDKSERVSKVVEPLDAVTTFVYSFVSTPHTIDGQTRPSYATTVQGPRPEVPATTYLLDPYGSASGVLRPLNEKTTAETRTLWSRDHVRPEVEIDPRGRVTRYKYDAFGNRIEARTDTPALTAGGPATEALVDENGAPVKQVVEKWSFDPAFAAPTCHIDPSGRATTFVIDSNGTDPRSGTPSGTGLVLEARKLAKLVAPELLAGTGSCAELVRSLDSPQDVVTKRFYCKVRSSSCPTNAGLGDLSYELDGNGNRREVLAYNALGQVERERVSPKSGVYVSTTFDYDEWARLRSQIDTRGGSLTQGYDALDRLTSKTQLNVKGGSPSVGAGWTYYPGGQLKTEANGLGLFREFKLDRLNRVELVTESGGGIGKLETHYEHDHAGNVTATIDRRGVRTEVDYDFGDRAVRRRVSVENLAAFTEQGGLARPVGIEGVVAEFTYDAAGNKVAEKDLHGFQTEYVFDPLYRVVATRNPEVPGADFGSASVKYAARRAYDLVGNVVAETDGNGATTRHAYDFAGRRVRTEDPVGRVERLAYDVSNNLRSRVVEGGKVEQLVQTYAPYDGLNRPTELTETVFGQAAAYHSAFAYDDGQNITYSRDRRGLVTKRELDDLGRVFRETVDVPDAPLARTPDTSGAGAALALVTQYRYDGNGNLAVKQDALGRETTEVFDGLNRKTSRLLPMGLQESIVYDGEGNAISQTDARGIVRTTKRDPLGRAVEERLVETLSNQGADLVTREVTYTDAPAGRLVSFQEKNARGATLLHRLDALGREVSTVDALSNERQARFDAVNKRGTKDAKGYVTTYEYDAANRLRYQRDYDVGSALRYTQKVTYDDAAGTTTAFDRNGVPTTTWKDGLGREIRSEHGTGALVQRISRELDGNGNTVRVTDANLHSVETVFDGANRAVRETAGLCASGATDCTEIGAATTHRYDAVGNVLETKGPRDTGSAFDVRFAYDALNHQVRQEDALGNVTTRAFDALGNRLCEKRPLGTGHVDAASVGGLSTLADEYARVCSGDQLTQWAYDEASKLVSVTDALGGVHSFVYDPNRNLVAKQDANGNLTTYEYDLLDRRTHEHQHLDLHSRLTSASRGSVPLEETPNTVSAGTLSRSTHYDANGNPDGQVDPLGQLAFASYGVLNRLEGQTFANHRLPREFPSLNSISFLYDNNGNVRRVTESKETPDGPVDEVTTRILDGLDRLRVQRRYDGKELAYEYDTKGNRAALIDSEQGRTEYRYDALDRLSAVTFDGKSTTYTYWPDSLKKGTVYPNGLAEKRCYDAVGRVTQMVVGRGGVSDACAAGTLVSRFAYGYDANGNRLSQEEQRTEAGVTSVGAVERTEYGYDSLDRLIGTKDPDGTATLYRLDPVGNRLGERKTLASKVAALTVAAFAALAPDDATADTTSVFNRADWLVSLTDAKDASRNRTFEYDLNGNLVEKTSPTSVRTFQWDIRNTLTSVTEGGSLLGRYDYDWNKQRVKRTTASERVEYVLDDDYVLEEASGASAEHPVSRRYHYGDGEAVGVSDIAREVAGPGGPVTSTQFLLYDALGSLTTLTNATGAIADTRQYDAWGEYRNGSAPTASETKVSFTGHQFDLETGLTYARARYYDAETGRFLSADPREAPIAEAPSLHRYAYANENPLRFTDRTGAVGEMPTPEYDRATCGGGNCTEQQKQIAYESNAKAGFLGAKFYGGTIIAGVCLFAPPLCEAAGAIALGGLVTSGQPTVNSIDEQVQSCIGPKSDGFDCAGNVALVAPGAIVFGGLKFGGGRAAAGTVEEMAGTPGVVLGPSAGEVPPMLARTSEALGSQQAPVPSGPAAAPELTAAGGAQGTRFSNGRLAGDGPEATLRDAPGFSDAAPEAVSSAQRAAEAVQTIPTKQISFSQSSVSGVAEIEASMRARGWDGDPIDIVRMADGRLVTIDNTRLLAAHRAGIDVRAVVHEAGDALPASLVERFTTRRGGVPSTWDDALKNRIGAQSAPYRQRYPGGSFTTGSTE